VCAALHSDTAACPAQMMGVACPYHETVPCGFNRTNKNLNTLNSYMSMCSACCFCPCLQIDAAIAGGFGMPMGPFRLSDLVGRCAVIL
jgi:hypothetical protein